MSVMRGYREQPITLTTYIVRDIGTLTFGSTQSAINAGVAASIAAGTNVSVVGNLIDMDPVAHAIYFTPDVTLNGGFLLRDMDKDLYFTYKGELYLKARLVARVNGVYSQGDDLTNAFYVTIFESYDPTGPGGENVYVIRVT